MILVDANLLMYAANGAAPEHDRARSWLDDRLNGSARVGLPWPSLLAFVRLATNPVIVRDPRVWPTPGSRSKNGLGASRRGRRCQGRSIPRYWGDCWSRRG